MRKNTVFRQLLLERTGHTVIGGRPGVTLLDAVTELQMQLEVDKSQGLHWCALFTDLTKAYEKLPITHVVGHLQRVGVPSPL
eukprot:2346689-Amphidinium_carterae.1